MIVWQKDSGLNIVMSLMTDGHEKRKKEKAK
jgi:hypothetical protein